MTDSTSTLGLELLHAAMSESYCERPWGSALVGAILGDGMLTDGKSDISSPLLHQFASWAHSRMRANRWHLI